MTDRYYNTVTGNEEFFPGPNIVILPPENVFWSQLPDGHELVYDMAGVPTGTQPIPPPAVGTTTAIRLELAGVGISQKTVTTALYMAHRGDMSLINLLDTALDTVALNQGVTLAAVAGEI